MKTANANALASLLAAPLLGACSWVGLGWGALTYPTTRDGETANVVAAGDWAYATAGAAGLDVLELGVARRERMALPAGLDSADDVAVADGLLFVLDARPPGHLAVFSLADPARPRLAGAPVEVDVGPFSGVTAAAGQVIVSGGTSRLSLRRYDADGRLDRDVSYADFGRGQPDALLAPRGNLAFVSTHTWGPHFGLTVIHTAAGAIAERGALPLETYGFTPGGAKPANFPIETAAEGSAVYVAFAGGLAVVDARAPAAPVLAAVLPLPVQAVNVDVRDGVAAVVGSVPEPLLVFVDVRDAARPKVLQSFPLPEGSRATGVAITADRAVVAAHGRGTLLLDRSSGAWESVTSPIIHLSAKE